jgi:hypothetical protein
MAIPSSPVIGTKYKFGSLRVNGAVQVNPTNPWASATTPTGASAAGNTPVYSSGAVAVGDSDASSANQINWVYVGNNKYISDRALLSTVSWDTLNTNGFVSGSTVTVDGVSVKVSLPSGGIQDRTSGTTGYAGGTPTANDWDTYIQNEGSISGLPATVATDKDSTLAAVDYTSANGTFWHWAGIYTWCKEFYQGNSSSSYRVVRGYPASSYRTYTGAAGANANVGFRPVLEVLNSAPLVSDPAADGSLGNKTQGFSVSYTVGEADGDKFSILAKVDSTTLVNTSNNAAGTFTLNITGSTWDNLAIGSHTITITVTDTKSAASTRTLTFNKTNTAPTSPVITGLSAGQRLGTSGSVSFNPATDADGDTLSYTLQFASDAAFAQNLQSFTGSSSPITFSGLTVNTSRYARVVASDGKATTASAAVQIKVGNVLEFKSNPINRPTMPVSCRVMMDWTVSDGATATLYVCNNANDSSPTWENCTSEFNAGTAHTFTNASKINASWAVGLRVVINAGTATGTIEVRAFGFDITVQ